VATVLAKCKAEAAIDIWKWLDPSDEARKALEEGRLTLESTPAAFLDALLSLALDVDALRFVAYALPPREAVWWATLCVRSVSDAPDELEALVAAEAWVQDASDEKRRAAMDVAETLGFDTSQAWTAVAAFWAEGSMAPPDSPAVPPGEELVGHAAAGAVALAAVEREPEKASEKRRRFVELGVEVSNGPTPWPDPPPATEEAREGEPS
jgi:hypothetical protein